MRCLGQMCLVLCVVNGDGCFFFQYVCMHLCIILAEVEEKREKVEEKRVVLRLGGGVWRVVLGLEVIE